MSYKVSLPRDKKCVWYHNSVHHYNNEWRKNNGKLTKSYERMFNVRLFTALNGSVYEIEFPSESDAVMFILRWS